MKHADVSERLNAIVKAVQAAQAQSATNILGGFGGVWMLPQPVGPWSGDLTEVHNVKYAFERSDENQTIIDAISSRANDGTSLDLALSNVQIAYLTAAERAFRQRHTDRIRCIAHAAGRRRSHGSDAGPLVSGILEPLRRLAAKRVK